MRVFIFVALLVVSCGNNDNPLVSDEPDFGDGRELILASQHSDNLSFIQTRGNVLIVKITTRDLQFNPTERVFIPTFKRYLRVWQSLPSGVITELASIVGDVFHRADDIEPAEEVGPGKFYSHIASLDSIWYEPQNGMIFYTNGWTDDGIIPKQNSVKIADLPILLESGVYREIEVQE